MNNAPPLPMSIVFVAVLVPIVVAFVIGYLFGKEAGGRQARVHAFNQLLTWSRLAGQGAPGWRLKADAALVKAGALIGGDDIVRDVAQRTTPISPSVVASPLLLKGNQL